ncbi:hypothetical protein JIN77_07825 [Verrucomicrobiaceae bacterium R5-34]|nr:hypothetical protein [Verrucomicrobiaceae bacterium R5-34]
MPTPEEKFKAAATRDFGEDQELRYQAEEILDAKMRPVEEGTLESGAEALAQNQSVWQWIRWSFYGLSFLLGLWIILNNGKQALETRAYLYAPGLSGIGWMGGGASSDTSSDASLSHEEKLILYGDLRYPTKSEQMHGLWAMEPENPAYYIEYATAYHQDMGSLPSDFLEQANAIDSGNGWYALVAAGVAAEGSVEKKPTPVTTSSPRGRRSRKGRIPKARARSAVSATPVKKPLVEYRVLDETKYQAALAGLYQSASLPQFDSHQMELLKQRVALLPQNGDFATRLKPVAYLASMSSPGFIISDLQKVVRAEATRCGEEKDAEGLRKLIGAWDTTGRRLNADTVTLIDALLARAWVEGAFETLAKAADQCDLPAEAQRFAALDEDAKARKELRNQRSDQSAALDSLERRGGILYHLAMPSITRTVDFPERVAGVDLKPGRMVDHAFFGRILSAMAWLLMLSFSVVVWVYRYRYGKVVRRLSTTLMSLARPLDWLWIIGAGVLLPLAYYWLITRYSPWSSHHQALTYLVALPALGQFLSMLVLMLTLPLLIARWRLRQRAGMLGFDLGGNSKAWLWPALAILALPSFGIVIEDYERMKLVVWSALASTAVCALWTLVRAVMACFGKRDQALQRVLVSRLLVAPYALATVIMAILVTVHHQEEYHWVQKDTNFLPSVEEPGFTRYEYRITQQARKELAEVMGWGD